MTTRILPEDVVIRPNLLKAIENTSPHSHIISFRPLALERLVGILLVQSSTGYIAGVLHDILQTYTCVVDRKQQEAFVVYRTQPPLSVMEALNEL